MKHPQPITSIKMLFVNQLYTETFEDKQKFNYDMFMNVALPNPPPTFVLTKRIFQRQHGVVDLSSINTYNNTK